MPLFKLSFVRHELMENKVVLLTVHKCTVSQIPPVPCANPTCLSLHSRVCKAAKLLPPFGSRTPQLGSSSLAFHYDHPRPPIFLVSLNLYVSCLYSCYSATEGRLKDGTRLHKMHPFFWHLFLP